MSYKEFRSENERVIVKNGVHFRFLCISEIEYVIEVVIPTGEDGRHIFISNIVTTIDAYRAYNSILNDGLK